MKLKHVLFGMAILLPQLLFAQINLSGELSGYHDYTGQDVNIQTGDTLRITPYGKNTDVDSTGWLYIKADNIYVNGVIDGLGRGYGGGGGGGGGTFGSVGLGGADNGPFEGVQGGGASSNAGGNGGDGGGKGGYSGEDGLHTDGGNGDQGGGPFGGFGGLGGTDGSDGENGKLGGYRISEANGDTTTDLSVFMGSGGGGGGGGAGGYRTSGGNGGAGGVEGGTGATDNQMSSGGGGGGGGTGGAALTLSTTGHLSVSGSVFTDGAGYASLSGGFGAGGGILLRADVIEISGLVKTVGGATGQGGEPTNGGTIKLAYNTLNGDIPVGNAGRILKRGYAVEERAQINPRSSAIQFGPNPFSTKVIIRYQLFQVERVAIKIFDVTGKRIATITDQNQSAGMHSTAWDSGELSSGVYFCRFTAGGTTITKPLTLIKQ
jgi:hypothetical protein